MPPAIEITKLTKSFTMGRRKTTILHDLSLTISKGDVFGFLGPNGAGKSTTIKLIMGFLRPDSGNISILGSAVGKDEFRHHLGYLSEFPVFYGHLTAPETLLLSGRLSNVSDAILKERIPNLLEKMNLSHAANVRVNDYSKGMKQRLGMANALIHDPELYIFDEPMSGLDPLGRHMIKKLLGELNARGKTIFFSSHILSDIEELCNQIAVIHKGQLLFAGGLSTFLQGDTLEEHFVTIIKGADNEKLS